MSAGCCCSLSPASSSPGSCAASGGCCCLPAGAPLSADWPPFWSAGHASRQGHWYHCGVSGFLLMLLSNMMKSTCSVARPVQGVMPHAQLQQGGLQLGLVQARQLVQLTQAPLADLLLGQPLLLGPLCAKQGRGGVMTLPGAARCNGPGMEVHLCARLARSVHPHLVGRSRPRWSCHSLWPRCQPWLCLADPSQHQSLQHVQISCVNSNIAANTWLLSGNQPWQSHLSTGTSRETGAHQQHAAHRPLLSFS